MMTASSRRSPVVPVPSTPSAAAGEPPTFLNTTEAAAFLRLSPRTLEKLRVLGGGPLYRKFGARVLYAVEDLQDWADSRSFGMTSDPGAPQRSGRR